MKEYTELEVQLHSFLVSALHDNLYSLGRFISGESDPHFRLNSGLGRPQSRYEHSGEEVSHCKQSNHDPSIAQPVD